MPTESVIPPPTPPSQSTNFNFPSTNPSVLKCSLCGVSGFASSSSSPQRDNQGVVLLNESIERLCGGCVRAQDIRQRMEEAVAEEGDQLALGLGLRGIRLSSGSAGSSIHTDDGRVGEEAMAQEPSKPHSVPAEPARPPSAASSVEPISTWASDSPQPMPVKTSERSPLETKDDSVPIRILEVCKSRIDNRGKGALYPGSTFKGTQTSGRSAYEVEVKIADVNLPESSVSGYLSIQHLTDAHPSLTTFFTGEIIGPDYGFITGERFGASENDDMRHWGRFEQFRRPATRGDMVRPDLTFRDPQPDRHRGETRAKDRDFMFLRIKERFLVPDHTVRDISGASFAGFYYAMIDFSPGLRQECEPDIPLASPTSPRAAPLSPPISGRRRTSSGGGYQGPSYRRQSMHETRTGQATHAKSPGPRDASPSMAEPTIRGYYFHSLNQEPFQELYLSHVPTRSLSTFEMR